MVLKQIVPWLRGEERGGEPQGRITGIWLTFSPSNAVYPLAIHLGRNDWAVVDSCVSRGSATPVAAEYLNALDGPGARVLMVIATHWHDDHVRGVSAILENQPDAQFACSMAIRSNEFLTLVGLASEADGAAAPVQELARVVRLLQQRDWSARYRWTALSAQLASPTRI
jgi:glyoxylase-like metal-dependent hydrolase (beta-lactamase superfamily II)